jgi:putative flippase GtrA
MVLKYFAFEHSLIVEASFNSFWTFCEKIVSGTIIRGTLKTPNSQLVTPISIKLLRPDGCD